MPLDVYDTIGGQVRLLQELGATALAEDADLFAKITMQIQSWCRRHIRENLSSLIE